MPRFSLKTLLIAAAVVPVAAYVLVNATQLIATIVLNIALLGWMTSLVLSRESGGELGAFARGFATITSAFAFVTWGNSSIQGNHYLVTSRLISRTYWDFGFVKSQFPDPESYYLVAQVYWCVIFGIVGGWFAAWLYRRRQKANQPSMEANNP